MFGLNMFTAGVQALGSVVDAAIAVNEYFSGDSTRQIPTTSESVSRRASLIDSPPSSPSLNASLHSRSRSLSISPLSPRPEERRTQSVSPGRPNGFQSSPQAFLSPAANGSNYVDIDDTDTRSQISDTTTASYASSESDSSIGDEVDDIGSHTPGLPKERFSPQSRMSEKGVLNSAESINRALDNFFESDTAKESGLNESGEWLRKEIQDNCNEIIRYSLSEGEFYEFIQYHTGEHGEDRSLSENIKGWASEFRESFQARTALHDILMLARPISVNSSWTDNIRSELKRLAGEAMEATAPAGRTKIRSDVAELLSTAARSNNLTGQLALEFYQFSCYLPDRKIFLQQLRDDIESVVAKLELPPDAKEGLVQDIMSSINMPPETAGGKAPIGQDKIFKQILEGLSPDDCLPDKTAELGSALTRLGNDLDNAVNAIETREDFRRVLGDALEAVAPGVRKALDETDSTHSGASSTITTASTTAPPRSLSLTYENLGKLVAAYLPPQGVTLTEAQEQRLEVLQTLFEAARDAPAGHPLSVAAHAALTALLAKAEAERDALVPDDASGTTLSGDLAFDSAHAYLQTLKEIQENLKTLLSSLTRPPTMRDFVRCASGAIALAIPINDQETDLGTDWLPAGETGIIDPEAFRTALEEWIMASSSSDASTVVASTTSGSRRSAQPSPQASGQQTTNGVNDSNKVKADDRPLSVTHPQKANTPETNPAAPPPATEEVNYREQYWDYWAGMVTKNPLSWLLYLMAALAGAFGWARNIAHHAATLVQSIVK